MKYLLLPLITLIISRNDGTAQLPPPVYHPGINQWFPGWYITPTGDTLKGYIYLSNQIDNQQTFKYSENEAPSLNERMVQPGQSFGYKVKDRVYDLLPIENEGKAAPLFVRRIESGGINLYTWYSLPTIGTVHDGWNDRPVTRDDEKFHQSNWIIRKGSDEPLWVPTGKNFAQFMSALTKDNETLSQKIQQKLKGYRAGDVVSIVQEYNDWKRKNP